MFTSMFQSLCTHLNKNKKIEKNNLNSEKIESARQYIEQLLKDDIEFNNEIKENQAYDESLTTFKNNVFMGIESITDTLAEYLNINCSVNDFDVTQNEVKSIIENIQISDEVIDPNKKIIIDKINDLHCPFTWNIKPICKNKLILSLQNKYGEYNLNISLAKFTFERYIANLVISYEMFHNGESNLAEMKVLEIGKWLEELDNGTDELYLSINTGLKYVMRATFIHMLFASNLIEECKWLLYDTDSFDNMDLKSKATVFGIRAAVLIEYGKYHRYYKTACQCAKNACKLDANTSHWFYIYSLAMTAERHLLYTFRSCPTKCEKNAIQQAIMLSNGRNISFNYQRMKLDKDTITSIFFNSKNRFDKNILEKNHQENKQIVLMIKTIISMEPKDPLIIVKCAKILITLPFMVRDFKLGIIYLKKAIEIAPNDPTVLYAVIKTFEAYTSISQKYKHRTTQNQSPLMNTLQNELILIVGKHKNGEDPIPYLTDLASNYKGYLKCAIMAEICSYTLLFTNNLRTSVEQFITLIEQPEIVNSSLITKHFSSFSSIELNLAERFCNEILLAACSSVNSSEDISFCCDMLPKIMKICNLNIQDIDSFMKVKLCVDPSARSTTNKINTNISIDQFLLLKHITGSCKENKKEEKCDKMLALNIAAKKRRIRLNEKISNNYNAIKHYQTKVHETNLDNNNKFKIKMFPNVSLNEPKYFNNSHWILEKLGNVQIHPELENYTNQLYKNIITNIRQKKYNYLYTSQDLNIFFNQNYVSFCPKYQQYPSQTQDNSSSILMPPKK